MKISDLPLSQPLFSFEVFPPKPTVDMQQIYTALDGMATLRPDFISVTFGAGGGSNNQKTVEITSEVKRRFGIEGVAHLPGIHLSEEDVLRILDDFRAHGIENILALRGDPSVDAAPVGRFCHADELITFIREHGDFHIMAACYPEGHPESHDLFSDLHHLKNKVEAGADHLITQLFLDNETFYTFREACARRRIHVPIEAGIMPVTSVSQIDRMIRLSGIRLPKNFETRVLAYERDPMAFRAAGIDFAVRQIRDLLNEGVDGIHLYTMNKPDIAQEIVSAVRAG